MWSFSFRITHQISVRVSVLQNTVGDRLKNSSDNEHFREGFLCSDNEHPWAYYAARKIA